MHGVPGVVFDGASAGGAATRLAPGLVTQGPVLYEPESGVLAADQCLAAFVEDGSLAVELGRRVTSVREGAPGRGRARPGAGGSGGSAVSAVTADGEVLEADVVVLCAGPSSLGLLDGGFDGGAGGNGGRAWSDGVSGRAAVTPPGGVLPCAPYGRRCPTVFIEWGDDMTYGLPVFGAGPQAGLFKVSHHTPECRSNATTRPTPPPCPTTMGCSRCSAGPSAGCCPASTPSPWPRSAASTTTPTTPTSCWTASDPSSSAVARSGHGFKFGPLLGQVLADLAEGVAPPVDLSASASTDDRHFGR